MNVKRPRRLDLNAPLLSTRRPFTTTTTTTTGITNIEISRSNSLCGSCHRVPFSWEQSPGKPKDIGKSDESEDKTLPLPKPPPIRWLEESTFVYESNCNVDVHIDVDIDGIDNNEDEFENEDDEDEDDSFSDAIDLFSLAESLNLSDKQERRNNTRENEDLESEISGKNGSSSPNFMIQKFLPAATALAASSLSALATSTHQEVISTSAKKKHTISVYPRDKTNRSCVPRKARQAYPSSRGCGLEMLFPWPWRAKHKLCGVKSPVRNAHSSLKQQLSPSNK